jgi:hypothetical protein
VARLPVLVTVVGLLVLGGLADRGSSPLTAPAAPVIRAMPVAAPPTALSSSWFCGGALAQPANTATGLIAVANATGTARRGTITLFADKGPTTTVPVGVGPYSRSVVPEKVAAPASVVAAVVDIDGGGAVVEQVVSGSSGVSRAACATTGSDRWYFADGTTQENSRLAVSLVNPYPEDAIVDLSFVTEQGSEAPADFQGIVVPARSVTGIDVGTHLRRRARVATTVAARAGRVVAWKTQVVGAPPSTAGQSGQPGQSGQSAQPLSPAQPAVPRVPGLSLTLGSPSPGTQWWWPDGLAADGVTERFQIYNPGPAAADVSLGVVLDQGSAEPFQLHILANDVATVVANTQSRVPKGVAHAAILRSTNGAGVVAERVIDAASPSPRSGLLDLAGARMSARQWVMASGGASPSLEEWVEVFNPGPVETTFSVAALSDGSLVDLPGLSGISVPSGRRVAVRINDHAPTVNNALLVEGHNDIVVEFDLYPVKGPGLPGGIGVPLGN